MSSPAAARETTWMWHWFGAGHAGRGFSLEWPIAQRRTRTAIPSSIVARPPAWHIKKEPTMPRPRKAIQVRRSELRLAAASRIDTSLPDLWY
jgi:hypothetical protein